MPRSTEGSTFLGGAEDWEESVWQEFYGYGG